MRRLQHSASHLHASDAVFEAMEEKIYDLGSPLGINTFLNRTLSLAYSRSIVSFLFQTLSEVFMRPRSHCLYYIDLALKAKFIALKLSVARTSICYIGLLDLISDVVVSNFRSLEYQRRPISSRPSLIV
jgi:hypothetical protein